MSELFLISENTQNYWSLYVNNKFFLCVYIKLLTTLCKWYKIIFFFCIKKLHLMSAEGYKNANDNKDN